jgi:hypothetical protein
MIQVIIPQTLTQLFVNFIKSFHYPLGQVKVLEKKESVKVRKRRRKEKNKL